MTNPNSLPDDGRMPPRPAPNHGPQPLLTSWILLGAAALVGICAISNQGFWMDEASTASSAITPTLAEWWGYLDFHQGSDPQMPVYMLYIWVWVKAFGCTEWGLRLANLPWLALGFLALPRRQAGFVVMLGVSPFVWYYMNEARPYVVQISATLMMIGGLSRLAEAPDGTPKNERLSFGTFCLGFVALAGSSLLGVIWCAAAAAVFVMLLGLETAWRLLRQSWLAAALTVIALAVLASYYVYNILRGMGASPGTTGFGNVVFIFYELLGFAGLGPGRSDIHGAGLKAFTSGYVLPLAAAGLVMAAVLLAGVKLVAREVPRRVWVGTIVPITGMALLLLAAGKARHLSLLGRHFAPLGVCLLMVFGAAVQRLWQAGGWQRWLAAAWLALNLASAESLRWSERHKKDDYRQASAYVLAAQAQGQRIWWCADGTAGNYYHVPLTKPFATSANPQQVWMIANPQPEWLATNPIPNMIILSKPELHDQKEVVRDYLKNHHFAVKETFSVFAVWTRP